MGHPIDRIVVRFIPGCAGALAIVLHLLGYSFVRSLTIAMLFVVAAMPILIVLNPGPRAKPFVERMKNRLLKPWI